MSDTVDPIGAAPETRNVHFLVLLFGASAAPIFWIGQLCLGYAITAYVCYPGDHPVMLSATGPLFAALMAFDAIALVAALAGGAVSWRTWHNLSELRHPSQHPRGRDRFLAIWGLFSSLWFFLAILFNTIVSLTVPPCLG
ncbi:MAG TPA: hypothetical protein VHC39_08705 [Rhizomicrobium sp.]|nr:hypothetical protein [Rhizomicrobium sp.]